MSHARTLAAFLVILASSVQMAEGQWKFGLTPSFASYFPVAQLADSGPRTEKQLNSPVVGVRATYWMGREVALEVGTAFTKSRILTETTGLLVSGGEATVRNGFLTFTSVRLLYKPARSNFFGFAGGSMITRRGNAWTGFSFPGRDNYGGVVGLGARSEVTSSLSLWVSVEAHLYSADFDGSGGLYYTRTLQNDLIVSIGVPIAILKR